MPPMPPIPPPGIGGVFSFSGISVTSASVVSNRPEIDAPFLLLHLGLGRRADIDDGHAAREFRETLLEFFAIVIARRFFDLTTDLRNASFDIDLLAFALDNGGVFLVDGGTLGPAELFELHVLELDAEIFRDATSAGQHRDVFQHRLATIAEAGRLDRTDLQCPAQFVHDESGKRFAFHVLSNDEERTTSFRYFL